MFNKFLLKQFGSSFLPVFLTLLFISSIIVLFQIAKVTSYVQLDLADLFKLYLLMSIKLLIFTVPISYFVALGNCFKKLSDFNEVIILFALGASPFKVARVFLALAGCISAVLVFITLVFIPASFNLYDNFIDYKKTIASISLKTSNYGQEVGGWVYYSKYSEGEKLYSLTLKNTKADEIAQAKTGRIYTKNAQIILELSDVRLIRLKPQEEVLNLKHLELRSSLGQIKGANSSWMDYWKDYKAKSKELVIYISLSMLPLASSLWVISWALVHERVQRSKLNSSSFIYLGLYFLPIVLFSQGHFYTIFACFICFSIISWLSFFIRLKRY